MNALLLVLLAPAWSAAPVRLSPAPVRSAAPLAAPDSAAPASAAPAPVAPTAESPHELMLATVREHRWNSVAVSRDFNKYAMALGESLKKRLLAADGRDHVLDLGAGEMVFARELAGALQRPETAPELMRRNPSKIPKVTAVGYAVSELPAPTPNFRPLVGRWFEDIPVEELRGGFGPVTVAVDMYGVLQYSDRPDVALRKIMEAFGPKAELWTYARDFIRTTIRMPNNRQTDFTSWLEEDVFGIVVGRIDKGRALRIRRNPARPLVIPSLVYKDEDQLAMESLPPYRVFRQLP